jgi:hypothetical protein
MIYKISFDIVPTIKYLEGTNDREYEICGNLQEMTACWEIVTNSQVSQKAERIWT